MPELGYRPVNKYLPPRAGRMAPPPSRRVRVIDAKPMSRPTGDRLLRWVDRLLSR